MYMQRVFGCACKTTCILSNGEKEGMRIHANFRLLNLNVPFLVVFMLHFYKGGHMCPCTSIKKHCESIQKVMDVIYKHRCM